MILWAVIWLIVCVMILGAIIMLSGFLVGWFGANRTGHEPPIRTATPARRYRERLTQVPYRSRKYNSDLTSDENLLAWVHELHDSYEADTGEFLVASVGLLAFGHLEAYRDVLEKRLPRFYLGTFYSDDLVTIAADIFPLPFERKNEGYLDDEDAQRIIEWVEANKHQLSWSETDGRFVLDSTRDPQQPDATT